MGGDRAADPKRALFMYSDLLKGNVRHQSRAVLLGNFKFIRDVSSGVTELFDVSADPAERNDLSKRLPKVATELGEQLDAWESDTVQRNSSSNGPRAPRQATR
jgi:hypothetical protein